MEGPYGTTDDTHLLTEWKRLVAADETRLGYWDWVEAESEDAWFREENDNDTNS